MSIGYGYKGKDKDEHIGILKKKLQILRTSYISLRDSKNQAAEEVDMLKRKYEVLSQELEDKVK